MRSVGALAFAVLAACTAFGAAPDDPTSPSSPQADGGATGTSSSSSGSTPDGGDITAPTPFCPLQGPHVLCLDFESGDELGSVVAPDLLSDPEGALEADVRNAPLRGGKALRVSLKQPGFSIAALQGAFRMPFGGEPIAFSRAEMRFKVYVEKSRYNFARLAGFHYIKGGSPTFNTALTAYGYPQEEYGPSESKVELEGETGSPSGTSLTVEDGTWHDAKVELALVGAELRGVVSVDELTVAEPGRSVALDGNLFITFGLFETSNDNVDDEIVVWYDDVIVSVMSP